MDMSSLFPSDGMGNLLSSQLAPHVSFRAGVLNREPSTNQVTADPRKGTFQITTSPEDGLMHLQWRPRNNPTVEQDLILFSGENEMKQVTSCPATARVYVLKWKEADTRMFFWMQGADPIQDAANLTSVNAILDHGPDHQQTPPPVPPTEPSAVATNADPTATRDSVVPMEEAVSDSSAPAVQSRNPITLDQLRAALRRTERSPADRESHLATPSLVDLLNLETLQPHLSNPRVQELLPRLLEHLPEQDRTMDGLNEVLRSPPFRGQAATLSHALQTGGAADILQSFGLPADTSSSAYGLQAFLNALVKYQNDSKPDQ